MSKLSRRELIRTVILVILLAVEVALIVWVNHSSNLQ